MPLFPSGEQYEIRRGQIRATITEVGGTLRSLAAGDLAVLDGFPVDEMDHDGRGQILMPWPNRLAGGHYTFDGKDLQVPISEPARGNAIHGLVRWATWSARERGDDHITMSYRLYPQPGYPFTLDLSVAYRLSEQGLSVELRATNIGAQSCPFGAGQHPYLRAGTPLIDPLLLHVPARSIHRYDERSIPIERIPVAGTPLDFRLPRPIGQTKIDMDYTDLEPDGDGRTRVLLTAPNGGPIIEIWLDGAFKHVTIYTGETVQPPERRRQGIAVEPMTCPPNAFNSGEDLLVLQPGETWQGAWGLEIRQ